MIKSNSRNVCSRKGLNASSSSCAQLADIHIAPIVRKLETLGNKMSKAKKPSKFNHSPHISELNCISKAQERNTPIIPAKQEYLVPPFSFRELTEN